MRHFKHLILLITLSIGLILSTNAQKITPFSTWNTKDLAKANSARNIKGMSFQEKKVIYFINLARLNGKLFVETYLKDYMEDVRIPKNKYYRSLIKTLKSQPPLHILTPKDDLIKEALKHAREMGRTGKKGHRSANHKSFEERMEPFREKYSKIRESNQYGFPDALSIVIDLLIDDDQESLIHRRALLNKDLRYIGVGIRSHKKYRINTSILMAGELIKQ